MRSDWMEAFRVFSEWRNFTHAAAAMHISQPALHVKIRNLSEWLGMPLYRKVGREIMLTTAGRELAAFARDYDERSATFVETLRSGSARGPVSLCAGEGAYLYLLGPSLAQFCQDEAGALQLLSGNHERTAELVLSGVAHLGVSAPDTTPEGLTSQILTEVDQMLVVPAGHRLAAKSQVRLRDLDGEALIVPPQSRPHRVMINRMLMDAGIDWNVAVEASGWELMLHFVSLGLGSAIVNGCCSLRPGLIGRPLPELPRVRYQLLQRTGRQLNDAATELKAVLIENRQAWMTSRQQAPTSAN